MNFAISKPESDLKPDVCNSESVKQDGRVGEKNEGKRPEGQVVEIYTATSYRARSHANANEVGKHAEPKQVATSANAIPTERKKQLFRKFNTRFTGIAKKAASAAATAVIVLIAISVLLLWTIIGLVNFAGDNPVPKDGAGIQKRTEKPAQSRSLQKRQLEKAKDVRVPERKPILKKEMLPTGPSSLSKLFILPIAGVHIPTNPGCLPNAPREYRGGIHPATDFFVPYGTEVRACYPGHVTIVRTQSYQLNPAFRQKLLNTSKSLGKTPEDIYELLLGNYLLIDHGIIGGKRVVTRYAHLSGIAPGIYPGSYVEAGQPLGRVGNSGTSDDGQNDKQAHLDFTVLIDDQWYPQGVAPEKAREILLDIFRESN